MICSWLMIDFDWFVARLVSWIKVDLLNKELLTGNLLPVVVVFIYHGYFQKWAIPKKAFGFFESGDVNIQLGVSQSWGLQYTTAFLTVQAISFIMFRHVWDTNSNLSPIPTATHIMYSYVFYISYVIYISCSCFIYHVLGGVHFHPFPLTEKSMLAGQNFWGYHHILSGDQFLWARRPFAAGLEVIRGLLSSGAFEIRWIDLTGSKDEQRSSVQNTYWLIFGD